MAAAGVQENAGFNAALAGGNHVVAVAADKRSSIDGGGKFGMYFAPQGIRREKRETH